MGYGMVYSALGLHPGVTKWRPTLWEASLIKQPGLKPMRVVQRTKGFVLTELGW